MPAYSDRMLSDCQINPGRGWALDLDFGLLREKVGHRKKQKTGGVVGVSVSHGAARRPTQRSRSRRPDLLEDSIRNLVRECHTSDSIRYVGTSDMQVKRAKNKSRRLRIGRRIRIEC
jgi:hypothetical protein